MKTRFLAWDLRFGRVVIQAGTLDALQRILREGEYPLALMLLGESDTLTASNCTTPEQFAVAVNVYNVNRMLGA